MIRSAVAIGILIACTAVFAGCGNVSAPGTGSGTSSKDDSFVDEARRDPMAKRDPEHATAREEKDLRDKSFMGTSWEVADFHICSEAVAVRDAALKEGWAIRTISDMDMLHSPNAAARNFSMSAVKKLSSGTQAVMIVYLVQQKIQMPNFTLSISPVTKKQAKDIDNMRTGDPHQKVNCARLR